MAGIGSLYPLDLDENLDYGLDFDPDYPQDEDLDESDSDLPDHGGSDTGTHPSLQQKQCTRFHAGSTSDGSHISAMKVKKILDFIDTKGLTVASFLDGLCWGNMECIQDDKNFLDYFIISDFWRPSHNKAKTSPPIIKEFAINYVTDITRSEMAAIAPLFTLADDPLSLESLISLNFEKLSDNLEKEVMGPAIPAAMNDPLPTSVPCLDPTGSNWAIFSMRFQEAMEANQNLQDNEKSAINEWKHEETIAKYILSQRLPNSTAVCLKTLQSAKERWDKVMTEFSVKSQYAETDLLTTFSKMCCPRGGDVRTFLGQMCVKREELATVGVTMTEKEYRSAIIKAIPDEMSKFASGLLTAARVLQPSTSINPDILIDHIFEEADCLAARHKCEGGSSGKGKQPQSQDEAMAATSGDGGKKWRKGKL
ncbi:hypothetical protein BJY52DRAFT_1186356 [Lactarius psammicola]|nr:hypothetical protein BJY52DRAFT_1186356 [Lactarius psammicola]